MVHFTSAFYTGRWYGAFDGHDLENTSYVDVDHMVPLRNAHISGAWAWSPEKKEMYANFLEDDGHLIAVASRANRSKGAPGTGGMETTGRDLLV